MSANRQHSRFQFSGRHTTLHLERHDHQLLCGHTECVFTHVAQSHPHRKFSTPPSPRSPDHHEKSAFQFIFPPRSVIRGPGPHATRRLGFVSFGLSSVDAFGDILPLDTLCPFAFQLRPATMVKGAAVYTMVRNHITPPRAVCVLPARDKATASLLHILQHCVVTG